MMKHKIVIWISCVLLIVAVGAIALFWKGSPSQPVQSGNPVGTKPQQPGVDQRPMPSASPSAPSSSAQQPEGGASSSQPEENEPTAESTPAPAQSVRGTIVDVTISSVAIREEKTGNELYFMRESAKVTGSLVLDAQAEIFFEGKIEGNDASQVYVTEIVVYPG